ncbi:hypothetical protein Tco_1272816 [Tanacetum coccineum]
MSPRKLKRVLQTLSPPQEKSIQDMGFGDFLNGSFDFYYTPSELGMWVVRNFDPNSCTITMEDGRKIKITRELIHGILGIPMGDIKVESQKEKNLSDKVTAKWRKSVKKIVNKKSNTINISKLEQHLIHLSKCDWEFNLGFLVLFFSIFGLGNKDGTVNERIIPFLPNTDDVSKMDWCSYALECMVRGCKEYKLGKYFSGPLLLMAIIYVNSTVSETVKVDKTVPAFKAWNSNLLLKREQEEIELGGFGRLPIVEDLKEIETKKKKTLKKKNLIENRSITEDIDPTEDVLDKNEDFKSLDFEEMKNILRQNLVKSYKLMVDTDYKLKIALSFNPEDEELKKMIEERNNVFLDFFEVEDNNENLEAEEIDGDKNENSNENTLKKCHNEEIEGEEIGSEEAEGNKDKCEENEGNEEQKETYWESNEDEIQNEAEHNKSENIDNIGNLSLSTGQKTTVNASVESIVNAPVESIVNATVESTDNVVAVLPQICVQSKESDTLDVATKKEVEVKKAKVLKEKRTVKPSSNFYDRRINISEPLSEEEKKIVEYIWSDSCPEGDIVFASKGLELECLWFLSLYPEIKVDASVIDVWSDVLNHEEKYRRNVSITTHVYCWTEMLPSYLVEDKNKVNERRRIFDDNVAMILENSMKKNFNHVDLNAKIDIIDNINNDVEDISKRYGAYAVALIDSFINYLERHNHPSIFAIVNANPKQVPMKWNTRNKSVDSGVFVMRHMETYLGHEEIWQEDAGEKSQLYILRAKYLAKILLISFNQKKKELLKAATSYSKKHNKLV